MSGLYKVPFYSVAPRGANSFGATTPKDSFMDVARCIRERIYAYLKVQPESCEVPKSGDDKDLNKLLENYLICYKNMSRSNVSRTGFTYS